MNSKEKTLHLIKKKVSGVLLILISINMLIGNLLPRYSIEIFILLTAKMKQFTGFGQYFFVLLLFLEGLFLLFNIRIPNYTNKIVGLTAIIFILLTFIHLQLIFIEHAFWLAREGAGGGLYGYYTANYLYDYFGLTGAYLTLIALGLIAILFITDISFFIIFKGIFYKVASLFNALKVFLVNRTSLKQNKRKKDYQTTISRYDQKENRSTQKGKPQPIFKKVTEVKDDEKGPFPVQEKIIFSDGGLKNKSPIEHLSDYPYQSPPVDLLNNIRRDQKTQSLEKIKRNIDLLQDTLNNFGIDGEVVGATQGPTVTRYEIKPAPGVKVSKITNLSNDIALAFAAASVRIEAPIPGKNAIGIEVPNREKDIVLLREVIESKDYQDNSLILPIALGKDIGGNNVIADLVDLPHLLIAGSTGSGKSVCLNSIILSLIYRFGPDMVKLLMVDPKRVELNVYNGIPHLVIPIVTDTKKVDRVLNWALSEMESRFKTFAEVGVRNLEGYHDYVKSVKSDEKNLPYIVIIIDELADIMLSSPAKIEDSLCRLAQMTRATGIHLIIATQRPSVDIITGSIKINFPSRIAFAVSTQVDSRTILDVNGAEKLLGNGDMLFSPINASKPIRAQGTYVTEKEIKNIVSFLEGNNSSPDYQKNILEQMKIQDDKKMDGNNGEEDELYDEAVSTIVNNNQASISILQRKLRIGYTRAARLIDLMENKGIVGPYDGRNPRKILISKHDYFSNDDENIPSDDDE